MKTEKSAACYEEAKKYIPGGVNSPVRAFRAVGRSPLFIERAQGSKIYDIDGNVFIDYVCSWGPGILGHSPELARLIVEGVCAIEQVRLVSSGTEAVMSAIRVARGYTGKNKVVKFTGNYHGHSDGLLVKAGSGLMTESVPDSAGVPGGFAAYTIMA